MNKMTLDEALSVASTFEVEPETVASNGVEGMVVFHVPNFTVEDAITYLEVATFGSIKDLSSITVTADQTEECDLKVVTITINTKD